jgi:hypothetical protein
MRDSAGAADDLAGKAKDATEKVADLGKLVKAEEFVLEPGAAAMISREGVRVFAPGAVKGVDKAKEGAADLAQSIRDIVSEAERGMYLFDPSEPAVRIGYIGQTGQPIVGSEASGMSFQLGGRLPSTGPFVGHEGEFIMTRQATDAMGPQLLDAINRAAAMGGINVGGITINGAGEGLSNREQARALLPEIQRYIRRGVREGLS